MATVSELLKKARLEKNIDFSEVEKETRIKVSFIKALEDGQYRKLPSFAYARGFLANYARYLELDVPMVLALFRREFDQKKEEKLLPPGLSKIPNRRIRISSLAGFFILLFIFFLIYFLFQYKGFLGSPSLTLNSPSQNQEVLGEVVAAVGKTDPEVTLSINDQIVSLDKEGNFKEQIPVMPGEFTITVVSKNRFGRESRIIRMVRVR